MISVVVVNWNRATLLRNCLHSLQKQLDIELEIIVVDNGSTDGSLEMLNSEFAEIRIIRNPTNLGFCTANNQGIAAASADYIGLLNNDAEADPGWAAALLRACQSSLSVGMVASKILVHENPSIIDKSGPSDLSRRPK